MPRPSRFREPKLSSAQCAIVFGHERPDGKGLGRWWLRYVRTRPQLDRAAYQAVPGGPKYWPESVVRAELERCRIGNSRFTPEVISDRVYSYRHWVLCLGDDGVWTCTWSRNRSRILRVPGYLTFVTGVLDLAIATRGDMASKEVVA